MPVNVSKAYLPFLCGSGENDRNMWQCEHTESLRQETALHPPQFLLAFKFKIPKKINRILLGTNSCLNLFSVWKKG